MWSNRMFAGWALILVMILSVSSAMNKEYFDLFTLLVITAFIILSQRNGK